MISFALSDGIEEQFEGSTALVFVDETGIEDLSDPKAPFFGLAGCIVGASIYQKAIDEPWEKVEQAFPNQNNPLHAATLDMKTISESQLSSVADFFLYGQFGRVAAVATRATKNETNLELFDLVARTLKERIRDFLKICAVLPTRIAFVVEHSERLENLYETHFGHDSFDDGRGNFIPFDPYFQPKSPTLARGLAVADFIAQAAGGHSRRILNGNSDIRKDFAAVFRAHEGRFSSFMLIDRAVEEWVYIGRTIS